MIMRFRQTAYPLFVLLPLLVGCEGPIVASKPAIASGPPSEAGFVSLHIQAISPVVIELFEETQRSDVQSVPRAYLSAAKLRMRLTEESTGATIEWEETLETDYYQTRMSSAPAEPPQFATSPHPVTAGTYVAEVAIFGDPTDPNPVVSGTSDDFTVTPAETASTTVTCVPCNPTALLPGIPTADYTLERTWQLTYDEYGAIDTVTPGSELWFALTLDENSVGGLLTAMPSAAESGANLSLFVYNGNGEFEFDAAARAAGSPVAVNLPMADGDYFIGVIDRGDDELDRSFTLFVSPPPVE